MKITVVCGNGLGTSLMMEMSIKTILKQLGVEATVDHTDLASVRGISSDIFVATRDIAALLQSQAVNGTVVSLENMVDKTAMKERLLQALNALDIIASQQVNQ